MGNFLGNDYERSELYNPNFTHEFRKEVYNECLLYSEAPQKDVCSKILSDYHAEVDLYIATDYGEQFVKEQAMLIYIKRLNKEQMIALFSKNKYDCVVDATHPFAKIVSQNVKTATEYCNIQYYRIVRQADKNKDCIYFDRVEDIAEYLNCTEGNILLTTGSKDLDKFTDVKNYEKRIFLRILPMESSLKKAIELGYSNKNIICMQGPFSEELNAAMINSIVLNFL